MIVSIERWEKGIILTTNGFDKKTVSIIFNYFQFIDKLNIISKVP